MPASVQTPAGAHGVESCPPAASTNQSGLRRMKRQTQVPASMQRPQRAELELLQRHPCWLGLRPLAEAPQR